MLKKINSLLDNQEATLKLMANFTKETRELVTNFMREHRERKCYGCHCIKEWVTVLPKPCLGRLTTISTGDLRDGAVGDFRDGAVANFGDGMVEDFADSAIRDAGDGIRDDAIASGSSNSVGDSGNLEQLGEEGDVFFAGGS